jgi:transcriptional regulator with XRE-family HTH domain
VENNKIYTLEQQLHLGNKLKQVMKSKHWSSNRELASFAGVGHTAVGSLLRGPTDQSTFQLIVQIALALDIDIYTIISDLGLDVQVKNRMEEDDYATYFTNLRWMKDSLPQSNPLSPIEQIVRTLPEQNQNMARKTLINIVAQFSEID